MNSLLIAVPASRVYSEAHRTLLLSSKETFLNSFFFSFCSFVRTRFFNDDDDEFIIINAALPKRSSLC